MFFAKNQDMPFSVKLKVLNVCFLSTILYGCESWLNVSLKPVEKLYCGSIKVLLGVRSTTCNDLCLLELGMPSLQDYVNQKQRDFFQKLKNERVGRQDDPFLLSFQFMEENNKVLASYIEKLLERKNDILQESVRKLKMKVEMSQRSKVITYKDLSPGLNKCNLYQMEIPEQIRVNITRLRLSSHNLKVETGRWSQIPREARLCTCGSGDVQTERHIIAKCPLTLHIRQKYNCLNVDTSEVLRCSTKSNVYFINDVMDIFR